MYLVMSCMYLMYVPGDVSAIAGHVRYGTTLVAGAISAIALPFNSTSVEIGRDSRSVRDEHRGS